MTLMTAAFSVHGALAPYLPFNLNRDNKIMITRIIQTMDTAMSTPLDMLDGGGKEKES
jgi:hypothetical protein